jgi:ParB-like chromosome segregation protein Spo0J
MEEIATDVKELALKRLSELPKEEVTYKLSELPPNGDLLSPPPDQSLVDSIKAVGVFHPPVLFKFPDGLLVVAGKRRVKASRQAMIEIMEEWRKENGDDPIDPSEYAYVENIRCTVYTVEPTEDNINLARIIALMENNMRSGNILSEIKIVKKMISEGHVPAQIQKATKLNSIYFEQVMKFAGLEKEILDGIEDGKIAWGVAKQIVKLHPDRRKVPEVDEAGLPVEDEQGNRAMVTMAQAVKAGRRVTGTDVANAKRVQNTTARKTLQVSLPTITGNTKPTNPSETIGELLGLVKELLWVIDVGVADEEWLKKDKQAEIVKKARKVAKWKGK